MKKLIAILCIVFSTLTSFSQVTPIIGAGVQLTNNKLGEVVEVGAQSGNNRVTLVGEHFNVGNTDFIQTGVKYARVFPSSVVDILGQGALKVDVSQSGKNVLSFEPGIGAELKLGKAAALQTSVVTVLRENSDLLRPSRLKAGLSLLFKL